MTHGATWRGPRALEEDIAEASARLRGRAGVEPACAGTSPELWFAFDQAPAVEVAVLRQVCAACPLVRACRDYVDRLEGGSRSAFGVWAGETPAERLARRRSERLAARRARQAASQAARARATAAAQGVAS